MVKRGVRNRVEKKTRTSSNSKFIVLLVLGVIVFLGILVLIYLNYFSDSNNLFASPPASSSKPCSVSITNVYTSSSPMDSVPFNIVGTLVGTGDCKNKGPFTITYNWPPYPQDTAITATTTIAQPGQFTLSNVKFVFPRLQGHLVCGSIDANPKNLPSTVIPVFLGVAANNKVKWVHDVDASGNPKDFTTAEMWGNIFTAASYADAKLACLGTGVKGVSALCGTIGAYGAQFYDPGFQTCCLASDGGVKVLDGSGLSCCGTYFTSIYAYNPKSQTCCVNNRGLGAVEGGAGLSCCGPTSSFYRVYPYDPASEICCSSNSLPSTVGSNTLSCCGGWTLNSTVEACCDSSGGASGQRDVLAGGSKENPGCCSDADCNPTDKLLGGNVTDKQRWITLTASGIVAKKQCSSTQNVVSACVKNKCQFKCK